jgi:predicted dehydrogenase
MPDEGHVPTRRQFLHTTGALLATGAASHFASAQDVPLAPPQKQPPQHRRPHPPAKKLGYAIVGLGSLALGQVLPAFAVSTRSRPVALVSGHPDKARKVADAYNIDPKNIYTYENYDAIKDNPDIDIVNINLPNSMHAEYTVRAHKAGKHVLVEKPMANSVKDCQAMIDAAKQANKKLMVAYRLHYEPYNTTAMDFSKKKQFGDVHFVEAQNFQTTNPPNIRLSGPLGGGAVWDVGVYCINAARYLTGEEPAEVLGHTYSNPNDPRFKEVDETTTAILKFPSGAVAQVSCGFSSANSRRYRVVCSKGWFELENAYAYSGQRMRTSPTGGLVEDRTYPAVNHFAKQMDHFAQCVQDDKSPRTPGEEGLADIKVIEALFRSAREGRAVKL